MRGQLLTKFCSKKFVFLSKGKLKLDGISQNTQRLTKDYSQDMTSLKDLKFL